ncbi:hypothetical protein BGW80DRAFT_1289313 [Lactifluus volemus]|nr:hypothetical protein BGW80DRAFT_1289313 [Lactifluus volemus]
MRPEGFATLHRAQGVKTYNVVAMPVGRGRRRSLLAVLAHTGSMPVAAAQPVRVTFYI